MQVKKIILFGSRARQDNREDSDWDIGLIFDEITLEQSEDYLKMLRPLLPMQVDVKVLNTWKEMYTEVMAEGIVIWESTLR